MLKTHLPSDPAVTRLRIIDRLAVLIHVDAMAVAIPLYGPVGVRLSLLVSVLMRTAVGVHVQTLPVGVRLDVVDPVASTVLILDPSGADGGNRYKHDKKPWPASIDKLSFLPHFPLTGFFGFHSAASLWASAIWALVILAAMISRFLAAVSSP